MNEDSQADDGTKVDVNFLDGIEKRQIVRGQN
jgi:hypothetical protein